MGELFDDDWVAERRGHGERPGPSASVQFVVGRAPGGDRRWFARLDDGVVVEAAVGTDDSAAVTFTAIYDDAVALATGELDPSVAFMQGRLKTAGDPGLVLELLAHAARAGWPRAGI